MIITFDYLLASATSATSASDLTDLVRGLGASRSRSPAQKLPSGKKARISSPPGISSQKTTEIESEEVKEVVDIADLDIGKKKNMIN